MPGPEHSGSGIQHRDELCDLEVGFVLVAFFTHVLHGAAVSFAECMPIVIAQAALYRRMAIRFVVVCIFVAMVFEVSAGRLDTFMETSPLGIAIFRWRFVPPPLSFVLGLCGCWCGVG